MNVCEMVQGSVDGVLKYSVYLHLKQTTFDAIQLHQNSASEFFETKSILRHQYTWLVPWIFSVPDLMVVCEI